MNYIFYSLLNAVSKQGTYVLSSMFLCNIQVGPPSFYPNAYPIGMSTFDFVD